MKVVFFIIVSLLGILWLYLSFHFLKLDNINIVNYILYNNNYFEAIFFIGIFAFGLFLGRFFAFDTKNTVKFGNNNLLYHEEKNTEINNEEDENLKIIEGIGPKVEQLLKLNGIHTINQLSKSGYDELKMILERAGDNFKIINPRSWPYQAELATKKQWGKLKEYQDFLVGGIDKSEFNK